MTNFKKKLQEQIVDPAVFNRRNYNVSATITESNEKLNLCSVSFIDKDGKVSNKSNVPLKLYNENVIDWFPQVGDNVSLDITDTTYEIVGRSSGEYSSGIRSQNSLKKDVLPNSFIDTIAGMLF